MDSLVPRPSQKQGRARYLSHMSDVRSSKDLHVIVRRRAQLKFLCKTPRKGRDCSLEPRPSSPTFYLAAVEKNRIFLHGCEIKSGRGRPGFEATEIVHFSFRAHWLGRDKGKSF